VLVISVALGLGAAPARIPAGWSAHPLPDEPDWDCANWGRDWQVSRAPDGSLTIARLSERTVDPLPFSTSPPPKP
jgi:hypothetical protein